MAEYYSIVYMYHIFFIHSSVDGHLGCFHVLAIMSSAAINIGVHVSFFGYILFIYLLVIIIFLAALCGVQYLISLTRDRTCTPYSGSAES